ERKHCFESAVVSQANPGRQRCSKRLDIVFFVFLGANVSRGNEVDAIRVDFKWRTAGFGDVLDDPFDDRLAGKGHAAGGVVIAKECLPKAKIAVERVNQDFETA